MAPPVAKDFQALSCLLQLHLRQAVTKLDGLLFTPFFWGLRCSSVMLAGSALYKSMPQ